MSGGDLEGNRVDECERVEEMSETLCVELLRCLGVTLAGSHVPRLVVANGSAVGATATLGA